MLSMTPLHPHPHTPAFSLLSAHVMAYGCSRVWYDLGQSWLTETVELLMVTIEERVSRIEGGYEHLATKVDLAHLESRLMMRLGGLIVVATGIIVAAMRFWQ